MGMNCIRSSVLASALLLAGATGAAAQSALIGVYDDTGQPACDVDLPTNVFKTFTIKLHSSLGPVATARFTITPSCAATIFGADFDLVFAPCINPGDVIATFGCVNFGPPITGCSFDVVPAAGDSRIVMTDCEGYAMTGSDVFGWALPCDPFLLGAYRPDPADGAVDVPVNVQLGFVGYANTVFMADQPFENPDDADRVVCATQPGSYYDAPPCTYPVDPGLLLPYTTYYWKTWYICWGCSEGNIGESEVFSFTTGGPVTTRHATWGHVKAIYRE
jgi:hypothetical protein